MDKSERRERNDRNDRIAISVKRETVHAVLNAEQKAEEYHLATKIRDFARSAATVPRVHAAWVAAVARAAQWGIINNASPDNVRDLLRAAVDNCILRAAHETDASIVKGMIEAAAKMIEIIRWDGGD